MRRLASFVALFLLLTAVAPVLACVTGGGMTREESACCRAMHANGHAQCGEMVQMGCCKTEVRTDETPQIAVTSPVTEVRWLVIAKLVQQAGSPRSMATALLRSPEDYCPPGLVTARTTVLRI